MKRQKNATATANQGANGATARPADAAPDPSDDGTAAAAPEAPAQAAPPVPPKLPEATPEERLASLAAERDDLKDRMLRIAAEFENWKKRARKEQTDTVAEARERVLKDMLEVVDYLERAVATGNGGVDG